MPNVKLLLIPIITFTGLSLAACTKPTSDISDPTVTINDGEMVLESSNPDDLGPDSVSENVLGDSSEEQTNGLNSNNFSLDQNQTTQNSINNTQEGPAMKGLSDFAPIEASQATLHTSKGDIDIELYRDLAPITTINFLTLAKEGFYDGVVFHRVIDDFMAQVGDPKSKDPSLKSQWGTGGPGYTIPDEFGAGLTHDSAGIVSMANAGPNTGGSQFFITFGPTEWLDGKHAIFGKVTSGMDVVNSLQIGDKIESVSYK